MSFTENQFSLDVGENFLLTQERIEYRDIIIDRKSKYTIVAFKVSDISKIKSIFKKLQSDAYFKKATHNSYSYRIMQNNGSILEGKNDDGEGGAGMCILRELQRENAINIMIVVSRYFGGVQLHNDRFKNVIDACKIFFEKENIKKH